MVRKVVFGLMDWIWRLTWLNLLWILFSLPLITIIPSTFAMYVVVNKWLTDENEIDILPTFFSAFKKYFIKSFPLGSMLLLIGGFLYFDLKILIGQTDDFMMILRYAILILAILFVPIACYSIQVFIEHGCPWYKAMAVAFFITLKKPQNTISVLCGFVFVVLFVLFFTGLGILIVASLCALLTSKVALDGMKEIKGLNHIEIV